MVLAKMLSHFALIGKKKQGNWFLASISLFQLSHSVLCTLLINAPHICVLICSTCRFKSNATTIGLDCPLPS